MKSTTRFGLTCALIAAFGIASHGVLAQESDASAESAATDKSDKTGTNPVNFQRDIRIYSEYAWLNTDGDGNQNVVTLEYRQPLLDGKYQFRVKLPYVSYFKADLNDDGSNDIDETGLGDANFRILKQPWFSGPHAIAPAIEVFLNTASEDELGSGTTTLGPQVFYAFFFGQNPLKIPGYLGGGLFAPGLQYRFSVDEDSGRDEVEAWAIDLNFLALAEDRASWIYINPQILLDQENDQDYAFFDVEFGWMMQQWNPEAKGQSFYLRPSYTLGSDDDRPTDYAFEVGYKWVGW